MTIFSRILGLAGKIDLFMTVRLSFIFLGYRKNKDCGYVAESDVILYDPLTSSDVRCGYLNSMNSTWRCVNATQAACPLRARFLHDNQQEKYSLEV